METGKNPHLVQFIEIVRTDSRPFIPNGLFRTYISNKMESGFEELLELPAFTKVARNQLSVLVVFIKIIVRLIFIINIVAETIRVYVESAKICFSLPVVLFQFFLDIEVPLVVPHVYPLSLYQKSRSSFLDTQNFLDYQTCCFHAQGPEGNQHHIVYDSSRIWFTDVGSKIIEKGLQAVKLTAPKILTSWSEEHYFTLASLGC